MAGNETNAMLGQKRLKKSLDRQSKPGQLHELAYGMLSPPARSHPTQVSIIQEGHRVDRRAMGGSMVVGKYA